MTVQRSRFLSIAALLALATMSKPASAQVADQCLYNDAHFHVQDFRAQGCRSPTS